jgi:threonine aldolase
MTSRRYDFASDNTAPACPEAMAALIEANQGALASYGADVVTKAAAEKVRALLDVEAEVKFLASGTAANALSLAALCRPFEAVLAHEHAHVATDETGAPGFFGHGLGLIGLKGPSGKIDPDALATALEPGDSAHRQSPAALSITNATEYGGVYDAEALEALCAPARAKGLAIHLDGARLANAAAAGLDVRRLKGLGVDILVLGGTKAGASLSEAVVLFNPALGRRFDARLKQSGQLASKSRFLAAPWLGLLEDDAWRRRAGHANAMAAQLARALPFETTHPVEANAVFARIDEETLRAIQDRGWMVHRVLDGSVRFMCSWATTPEAVEELVFDLKSLRP